MLGPQIMNIYDLNPLNDGYLSHYDNFLLPLAYNEFGVAAYRLHTTVHSLVQRADVNLRATSIVPLVQAFYNTSEAFQHLDAIARGTLLETTYPLNLQMADALNQHLFENTVKPVDNFSGRARSLGAINIQRGRDHGLRPYNDYRSLCGLNRASTFDDLTNVPTVNLQRLRDNYADVNDIDLYTGGVSEVSVTGGNVGETFACK